jgi:hypothetical protein
MYPFKSFDLFYLACMHIYFTKLKLVAPVVLLLLQTRWQFMNEKAAGAVMTKTEHIRCHLWNEYSVTAKQAIVTTVDLSEWWLQFNH